MPPTFFDKMPFFNLPKQVSFEGSILRFHFKMVSMPVLSTVEVVEPIFS
jgi:hypothetical protein